MKLTDRGWKEAFVFRVVDVSFSSLSNRARADSKKIQMRVRDRRALPREAACFRDGQIDVGRSAFVCTGGAESELGKGGKYVEGDVSWHKKRQQLSSTHASESTRMSVRAPKWSRRSIDGHSTAACMCSGVGLASSSSSAVGLAGRPCWVKGHCCLVPACQAVAVDHLQVTTWRAPSKRQELVCWRKKVTLAACVRTARTVWTASLTLVAEALRALSGLGLCSLVSWAKIPGPWAPIETTCASSETRRQKKDVDLDPRYTARCVRTTRLAWKDGNFEAPFGRLGRWSSKVSFFSAKQ